MAFAMFVICAMAYIVCSVGSAFRSRWRVRLYAGAIAAAVGAAVTEAVIGNWLVAACWSVFAVLEVVGLLLTRRLSASEVTQ